MSNHTGRCPKLPWMIDFFSSEPKEVLNNQLSAVYKGNYLDYMRGLSFESKVGKKRLTGIMCSVGLNTMSVNNLVQLIEAGMGVALLDSSLVNMQNYAICIENIRAAADKYSKKIGSMYPVGIAMELRGVEIKTGVIEDGKHEVALNKGNETMITSDPMYEEHVTKDMIYVDYQNINEVIEPGDKLIIDDKIRLSALEVVGSIIKCLIERTGKFTSRSNVRMESKVVDMSTISETDIAFALEHRVDFVVVPSIKNKDTIVEVKTRLGEQGRWTQIVAKIENAASVKNVDDILKDADAILLSRSELSTEIQAEKLFLVQKTIAAACNKAGKPLICPLQFLDSYCDSPEPKKGNIMDAANAILDGVDCILLSQETSAGHFGADCVRALSQVCLEAEAATYQKQVFECIANDVPLPFEPIYALAIGVVETSLRCSSAAIIVLTTSGRTPKIVAKYRPRCPIVAITRYGRVARNLRIVRSIEPIHFIAPPLDNWEQDVQNRIQFGITYGKYLGFIRAGDTVIVVRSTRAGTGFTNCMQIYYASDYEIPD